MEKEKFLFPKKIIILVFFILSFAYNSTYSQCINPTPTGNTSQVFCKSDNSTLENLVVSGGIIVWYDALSGGELYGTTEALVNGKTYYADDISGDNCSTSRLAVTVTIYGDFPTNVDVSVGKCAIDNPTVGSLSAIGENIEWYDAQTGGNFLPLSQLLESGKTYWVQQTENGCTSARFPTTVSLIDPVTPTTAPIQSFCSPPNPTVANLSASGTTFLWYDSETSTTPLKSTALLIDGEDYWVAEIAFPCVSSNRAQTTVVLDTAPNAGESSTLTECEVNFVTTNLFDLLGGTPDPTGIWTGPSELANGYFGTFDPEINTLGTYTYTVSSTLGICPDASANVTIIITVIPPPTVTETTQSFCIDEFLPNGPTVGDLSPGGSDILWYGSETDTVSIDPTVALINGNEYWAAKLDATSGCESTTRIRVTVALDTSPNAGTNGTYTECEANLVTSDLFSLLGGTPDTTGVWTGPSVLTGGYLGTFNPDTNVEGTYTYTVSSSLGICPNSSANITVTVNVIPPPTITETTQSFCESQNALVSDLTPNNANIIWYNATGNVLTSDTTLEDGIYSAAQTQEFGTLTCESDNRTNVTVTIFNPITPTGNQNQSFCLADNPTIAALHAETSNPNFTLLWYIDDVTTIALLPNEPLVNGTTYYASEVAALECESNSRLAVLVTLNDVAPATIVNISQTFCESDFPTVDNLDASGNNIVWYASQTETTPLANTSLLIDGKSYWAVQSNPTTGCESSVRVVVNVTLTAIATPTLISLGNEFCKINNPTIADLNLNVSVNNGGAISWYDAFPNGNLLNASAALVEGETYYAIETNANGCKNINPLEVTVTLEACDEYDVEIYDGFSPTGNGTNDTFKIKNLRELYPDFKVEFFNRWGNLIYTANAANGDWNGRLNGDGELSPAGVYFFIVYFNKENRKPIQRSLYLSR